MQGRILVILALLSFITISQILIFIYKNLTTDSYASAQDQFSFLTRNISIPSSTNPDFPQSTCEIHEPVYTREELFYIFTKRNYSNCKTPTNDKISFENFKISAKCENGSPLFAVDPGLPQKFGGEVKDKVVWSENYEFRPRSEYFFVKCGEKSIYATVFNRFNSTVSERANKLRFSLSSDTKNFNVFLLVFDSLSRYVSKNILTNFNSFLKEIQANSIPNYSMHELKKSGLPDAFTLANMPQILYGHNWESIKRKIPIKKLPLNSTSEPLINFQLENSIWSYFSNQGFTTMYLYDTVWDFTSRFIGRDVKADVVFQNFWRSAWDVYGWHDFLSKQRCMGRQNSHNLSFTYAYEYLKNYKDNNKFAYMHLGAAHESTGNVATIDKDLKNFVKSTLDLMASRNENIVFYVISDHGWKYQRLETDTRYHSESVSPMTYIIMSKEVEEKLACRENLEYNSDQLVSRFDINLSLKYLAHYQSGLPTNLETLKEKYSTKSIFNFFSEKIIHNRTCADIGVPSHRCICSWFTEYNTSLSEYETLNTKILELSKDYLSNNITGCKAPESLEIVSGKKFVIHPPDKGSITFYQIQFNVNGNLKADGFFMFCVPSKIKSGVYFLDSLKYPKTSYMVGKNSHTVQLYNLTVEGCQTGCLC